MLANAFALHIRDNDAALAAPARNCDRFSDPFEATRAWNDYCVQVAERGGKILGWAEWLFATAEKKGGEK